MAGNKTRYPESRACAPAEPHHRDAQHCASVLLLTSSCANERPSRLHFFLKGFHFFFFLNWVRNTKICTCQVCDFGLLISLHLNLTSLILTVADEYHVMRGSRGMIPASGSPVLPVTTTPATPTLRSLPHFSSSSQAPWGPISNQGLGVLLPDDFIFNMSRVRRQPGAGRLR